MTENGQIRMKAEETHTSSVELMLVLQEDVTPKTLELYRFLCHAHGETARKKLQQEVIQRLEASFDVQGQITTLQAQIEAYQEYIFELQNRFESLEKVQNGIEQILQEIQLLKQSKQPEPVEDEPKKHTRPSFAIRTLKRLQEKE